jgi:hypothetical protein
MKQIKILTFSSFLSGTGNYLENAEREIEKWINPGWYIVSSNLSFGVGHARDIETLYEILQKDY